MHRKGHYGAALLVYAPVGFVLLLVGLEEFAVIGGAIVVGGAMIPDKDQRIPFVKHRGITHTVWFALAVGGVLGAVGALVGASVGVLAAVVLGLFGLFVGVLMVGAHLLADALTPMGVRPFAPVDDRKYCLDVCRAANPIANYALLGLGILAVAAVAVLWNALV